MKFPECVRTTDVVIVSWRGVVNEQKQRDRGEEAKEKKKEIEVDVTSRRMIS